MPRNGSNVYSLPAIYLATTGSTITAIQHNSPLADIAADLNAARPITSGGTGAQTAADARANLGLRIGSDVAAAARGVPSGLIAMWSGTTANIPPGWLLCDGANGTPDLTDRFIVGAGSGTLYDPGDTGGANSVALTTAEMPSHTHGNGTLTAASAGNHRHSFSMDTGSSQGNDMVGGSDGQGPKTMYTNYDGEHTHDITGSTSSAGSGDAHENRPPYYALAFIMKS